MRDHKKIPRWGLSPRVRGNLGVGRPGSGRRRSIPARAGEPHGRSPLGNRGAVYPRACGGTAVRRLGRGIDLGLSPRVRGNHGVEQRGAEGGGSIPARAGEP